jgi:hypothetical protein
VYEVRTSNATLTPRGKAMFRADVDSSEERVEVFNGSVDVASSLGSWTLAKNSVLELSPGTDQPEQLSEGITQDDWDRWVQERESRVEAAQNGPAPTAYSNNGNGDSYGWSDLSYYGDWSYMQGLGYGWVPNVDAGWSPYSSGLWCWYPGFGYTWISADPWGWLPYHYGGWNFVPGIGWMWFPGSFGFGAWSPGLVTWYSGPGWIGWKPRPGRIRPGMTNPCSQGLSCGTAISTNAFQTGRPVRPGTALPVDLASGKRIEQPEILPDRQAMLPGRVVPQPAGFANARPVVGSFTPHASPGPGSGIVYDPASGLYVNDSRPPSRAAAQASNEPSIRPLPSTPGASELGAVQPSLGTPQKVGPKAAPQSHAGGWVHHSSPQSTSSSAAAPRSGGATAGGGASSGAARSGGGSMAGASSGGGSGSGRGMGGGFHGGGGSGSGGRR